MRAKARSVRSRQSAKRIVRRNAVFLVGFMGAGKTSVGRALAEQLNWTFEDLDDRIQQREGCTIAEIFRDSGEQGFRRAEHAALKQLLQELEGGTARIVALGGGAFVQPDNATLLKAFRAATIFLDAPAKELWQRCCEQAAQAGTERPLLRDVEQFERLYRQRRTGYRRASLTLQSGGQSVELVAARIARKLQLKKIDLREEEGEVE